MDSRKRSLPTLKQTLAAIRASSIWPAMADGIVRMYCPFYSIEEACRELFCPLCEAQLHPTEDIWVGRAVFCPGCRVPLEITRQEPLEMKRVEPLAILELVEGDWGD